mgnify:CR=1 FL=1
MRSLMLLPFAFACTPAAPALEPWHGHDDGTPFLGDDLATRFERVTRTYGDPGDARLLHDGPALRPREGVWAWPNELTVVEASDDLRVAWTGGGVQLLLWLPRTGLVDAVAFDTVGVGRPGAKADVTGVGQVAVPAGTEVDLDDTVDDHVYVEWTAWSPSSTALVSTWVHVGDIDQAWFPSTEVADNSGYDAWLDGAILDRPHGDVLAVSAEEDALVIEWAGEPEDGWHPVRWSNGATTVSGWAYEDDLTPIDGRSGGFSVGCGTRCGGVGFWSSPQDRVPANTPLRSGHDGPVVARTTRSLVVPGFDAGGGWLELDTPWGIAELWADPLDIPEPQAVATPGSG